MKQTAVEWLEEEMSKTYIFNQDDFDMFKKAKEMEKQQIIDAHGNQTKKSGGVSNYTYILTGKEYYNETFNK
jgi:hypothetical protein